jgi:hypothetical protein
MKGDGAKPHASAGTGDDAKYRTDVTGNTSSTIGHHFPPMILWIPQRLYRPNTRHFNSHFGRSVKGNWGHLDRARARCRRSLTLTSRLDHARHEPIAPARVLTALVGCTHAPRLLPATDGFGVVGDRVRDRVCLQVEMLQDRIPPRTCLRCVLHRGDEFLVSEAHLARQHG